MWSYTSRYWLGECPDYNATRGTTDCCFVPAGGRLTTEYEVVNEKVWRVGGDLVHNINYYFGINRNYLLNSDTFNTQKSRFRIHVKSTKECNMHIEAVFNLREITRIVKEGLKYPLTRYTYCLKQEVRIFCGCQSYRTMRAYRPRTINHTDQ
jgi:hypothetical protein